MIYLASWKNPARIRDWLVDLVARLPARVQTKLLAAFLTIAGLLIVLGAVGLQVLNGVNGRTEDLITLQRKIAAYHQVQHDTTNQLYSISTALLLQDDRMLDAALRQLNQFGYDLDRMEFVAADEAELLGEVRKEYDRFTVTVTRVVDVIRAGRTAEARNMQLAEIVPLADRLERMTNQLVNIAEADMVAAIDATGRTYRTSRIIVIAFALGSLLLALGLGYIISWSLVAPVREIEARLRRIAAGEFGQRVIVANRDELGELAGNVNQTSEQLGRLYQEIEARRLELSESLEQQTATSTILRAIAASPTDVQPVLDAVAESAAKLCDAYDAAILLKDGKSLTWKSHHGPIPIDFANWPIGRDWVTGRAFVDRKPVHVDDLTAAADEFPAGQAMAKRLGHRTILAMPLLREEEAIGALVIRRVEVRPFTQKQIELLTIFADQAVIAIENVRLFEEVQTRNRELSEALEQQTATGAILRAIAASPTNIQPVLDAVAESAAKLCDAYDAVVVLQDGESLAVKAHFGSIPVDVSKRPIGRGYVVGRAFLERKPLHVHDIMKAAGEFPESHATALREGTRTLLSVPMLREEEAIGVLGIRRLEMQPFSPKQIELCETFADQAVIAIENVRLFDEVQRRTRELARSVSELKALGDVSEAVNSTLDLKTVLETIVAKAVQLSEADAGAIYVFSKTSQTFKLKATYGMSKELIEAISHQVISITDAAIGEAAQRRSPVQVADLKTTNVSSLQKVVLDAGYRSVLVVPLLRPEKIVGAFVVRRKTPGLFQDSTVELMETFAAQSVLAIQNARLFSEIEEKSHQLEVASRHKSQFLANMSHELRTPLNSVLGFTEMLVDGLYGELPERAKATLSRVQTNGRHLLGLINDVLDLSKIEAGQLKLAVESYSVGQIVKSVVSATEPLARAKHLDLRTAVAENLPLGKGDERRLTQVLLNLVGNAIKFTDKGSIDIVAKMNNGFFEFIVRDTGPGIAPEQQARIFEEFHQVDDSSTREKGGTGLGLAISKRIVEMHKGNIGVESTVGGGSTFRVVLPVSVEEEVEA